MWKIYVAYSSPRKCGLMSSHKARARVGCTVRYSRTWQYKAIWLSQSIEFLRKCEWWKGGKVNVHPSWSTIGPQRLLCGFHWASNPGIKHEVPKMLFPMCRRVKEMAEALWNWSIREWQDPQDMAGVVHGELEKDIDERELRSHNGSARAEQKFSEF